MVTDMASGDVVCRACGVVVEGHIIDDRLEFYSEAVGARAGAAESWLLPAAPIVVANVPNRRRVLSNVDPYAVVRELFAVVEFMGRGFSTDVQDTAKLLCRDLSAERTVRCDARPLHAACALYLATKMHGNGIGRSKREIATEFRAYGVTERGLTATAKLFKDVLHDQPYSRQLMSGLGASDLINRCVDRLDVDSCTRRAVKKRAHELTHKIPEREVEGKTPCSVCSGVVACVLQELDVKLSKRQLVESCRVSAATLDKMTRAVTEWTQPRAQT